MEKQTRRKSAVDLYQEMFGTGLSELLNQARESNTRLSVVERKMSATTTSFESQNENEGWHVINVFAHNK